MRISNPILSGLLYSLVSLAIFAVAISLLLSTTGLREQSLSLYLFVVHAICATLGGYIAGKKTGYRGWYTGSLTGLIYMLVVMLSGFLGFDAPISSKMAVLAAIALICGAFGGILGVNAKR